jgi:2-hydroxy-6-oxonona-2,4-dienedioate hydrolase
MLHGTAASLESFCANIAEHAKYFHVFAIDMMGSGWTDKPDYPYTMKVYIEHVRGFMDALSIKTASFIGVSLGSGVAAYFSYIYPERSRSFVMVAPTGVVADQAAWEKLAISGTQDRLQSVAEPTAERIRDIFKVLLLHEEDIIDDLVGVRLGIYSAPEIKGVMPHIVAALKEMNRPHEEWRQTKMPILVVGAPDGNPTIYQNAKLIAELAPNATFVDMPDTEHWAQFEHPEIFNPLSIAFLQETAR